MYIWWKINFVFLKIQSFLPKQLIQKALILSGDLWGTFNKLIALLLCLLFMLDQEQFLFISFL